MYICVLFQFLVSLVMSVSFWAFSALYPLNLYIFELFFNPTPRHSPKLKVVTVLLSCSILLAFLEFPKFDFDLTTGTLYWFTVGFSAFIIPWIYSEFEVEEHCWSFLFWRNFVIAPACEELYYRILLPRLCDSILALSISFSLAHAHPLLFPRNWSSQSHQMKLIPGQCVISFCLALICNKIRIKSGTSGTNFWLFLSLSSIHGIANYCGLPLVGKSKSKSKINWIQAVILSLSIYLILK